MGRGFTLLLALGAVVTLDLVAWAVFLVELVRDKKVVRVMMILQRVPNLHVDIL